MNRTEARKLAKELVSKMTLDEKLSQLKHYAEPVERLGVPRYNWWNEALHGVARAGTATVFPQAIGLAASFDEDFQRTIGDTVATEGRAKFNMFIEQNDREIYKGLTYWSPNINIFRDPRWGRGHETYGEDPFLTARMGIAYVKGLQGDGEYMKTAACAKHYAVHSGPEATRHEVDVRPSDYDLWDTYLPAFEAVVKEGGVEAIMGAYNRVNGEPCCGSNMLIRDVLRGKWGFEGHFVSDCWAIEDFHVNHKVTDTAPESAAMALKAGCDINCGVTYLHLKQAYLDGLVTEEEIDASVIRAMTARYLLGLFDENCEYNSIGYEQNDSAENNALALKAAHKTMVLLKNDGILPLNREKIKSIAVIGPNADSILALEGNYCGTSSRYKTFLAGIRDACGDDIRVNYAQGAHLFSNRTVDILGPEGDRLSEARAAAKNSDVVVLCVGLDATLEGEQGDASNAFAAGDKLTLELPESQIRLIKAVVAMGKPVITVVAAGSALRVEEGNAVLWVGYPGQAGGTALADILFGKVNPSGKLPVTFYRTADDLPPIEDYTMQNRTYRYYKGEALYPFGFGMSYTKYDYSDLVYDADKRELTVTVRNVGNVAGEESVQAYIRDMDTNSHDLNWSLCAFKCVALQPGEEKRVALSVGENAFTTVDDAGIRAKRGSHFRFWVGGSQPDSVSCKLVGKAPLSVDVEC
ncbi:MAG: glycoside hydrolase family 3 protein [Clostridiales bacterium]|nr:glycoside hydrolase family 3 protein [Clostridiales bacterium]